MTKFQGLKCFYWISHCWSDQHKYLRQIRHLEPSLAVNVFFAKAKDIAIPLLSLSMLLLGVDAENRRYLSAITVVLCCFKFILMLSRYELTVPM